VLRFWECTNLLHKAGPLMGHSAQVIMIFMIMLGVLSGTNSNPSVPYGLRSKCYRVFSKAAQSLSSTAFCKIGTPSEVQVCAMNIDDANARVRAIEIEIRGLNLASCNKESQDFCKKLGFSEGACPAAPYRCKMPFKNECLEDADCKVPLQVCCATCEEESAAFQCDGFTEKLKDAYCQVGFKFLFAGPSYFFSHRFELDRKYEIAVFSNPALSPAF
jgi:hypothetical protein